MVLLEVELKDGREVVIGDYPRNVLMVQRYSRERKTGQWEGFEALYASDVVAICGTIDTETGIHLTVTGQEVPADA